MSIHKSGEFFSIVCQCFETYYEIFKFFCVVCLFVFYISNIFFQENALFRSMMIFVFVHELN